VPPTVFTPIVSSDFPSLLCLPLSLFAPAEDVDEEEDRLGFQETEEKVAEEEAAPVVLTGFAIGGEAGDGFAGAAKLEFKFCGWGRLACLS